MKVQERLEEMRRKYQGGYWGTEQDTTCVSVEVVADGVNPIYTEKEQRPSCRCWEQEEQQIDITVIEQGLTVFLQPRTQKGVLWVEMNIPREDLFQPHYPTLVYDRIHSFEAIAAMMLDGLELDSVLEEDTHV